MLASAAYLSQDPEGETRRKNPHSLHLFHYNAFVRHNHQHQIRIKNTNWGPYKFDAGNVTFLYQDTPVGTVVVPKGKAGMRGTKKINVDVSLNTVALPSSSTLSSELSGGVLTLTSEATLTGKVGLMLIVNKKKSASMSCTIQIDVSTKTVKSLECN
ncbi:hypothetical protein M0R45_024293 [Rubus argutus]|uniref:Late embryogenesis abundant protein LEA-2 subgroup domain-containing protein n=1 Tax=Rubus argutus TaxID=59490 RepID=A0AAW1WQQ6_RUBAR